MTPPLCPQTTAPWASSRWWPSLDAATAELAAPFGVIAWDAVAANAFDLLRRAAGVPIRVASKSVRVRAVLDSVLALDGYAGILAYTLPEALWLAQDHDDVVVGYPTVDRAALRTLGIDERAAARITVMIDSIDHLDLIDAVLEPAARGEIRVAIELDASLQVPVLGHLGVRRSPLHTPDQVVCLAREVLRRRGFRLVGLMAYEAQIAGVGNAGARNLPVRLMQRRSADELRDRRGAAVAAVRAMTDLEFVNGGGTGSIESTTADDSVTEVAAGSGLFGPHLFDHYEQFSPAPAAAFALPVVRRPGPDLVTLLGGGWVASGPPAVDRLPQVVWPTGLTMLPREAAGEVQTPLRGASSLRIGDRVWLRHTKAGELSEHLDAFAVVSSAPDGLRVTDSVPTYRGEGKVFL